MLGYLASGRDEPERGCCVRRIGSWLVLSFRMHRWEVLASAAGVAILTAAMLWFTWQLRTLAATAPGVR